MRAYVVGGGDISSFDWGEVEDGDLTVACHAAALRMPFAPTVQLSADRPYWEQNHPRLGSAGVWVTVGGRANDRRVPRVIIRVRPSSRDHWAHKWSDKIEDGVMVGGCSGVAAMNYAALRGAKEIHLVGVDLEGPPGRPWEKWGEAFQFAVDSCEARGIRVVPRGRWQPRATAG